MSMDLIMGKLDELVPLPQVVSKVLEMTNDQDISAAQIADVITKEEILAMKLLKLANSPFFGTRQRTNSIRQAIVILGMHNLRTFILSMGLVSSGHELKSNILNRVDFWRHNVATAVIAKEISNIYDFSINIDNIFLCGLLHDVGKLAMINFYKQKYDKIIAHSLQNSQPLFESERSFLTFDHQTVGFEIAKKWHFPKIIGNVIYSHHKQLKIYNSIQSKQEELEFCVILGNMLANVTCFGTSGDLITYFEKFNGDMLNKIKYENVLNIIRSYNDIVHLFELGSKAASVYSKYNTVVSLADKKLENVYQLLLGSFGFKIVTTNELPALVESNARILIIHDDVAVLRSVASDKASSRTIKITVNSWIEGPNKGKLYAHKFIKWLREEIRNAKSAA